MQFLPDGQDQHPTEAAETHPDAPKPEPTFDEVDAGSLQIFSGASHLPLTCPPYLKQALPKVQGRCPGEAPLPITQSLEFAVAAIDGDHLQLTAAATDALRAAAARAQRAFHLSTLIWASPWSKWPHPWDLTSRTYTDDAPGSRRDQSL